MLMGIITTPSYYIVGLHCNHAFPHTDMYISSVSFVFKAFACERFSVWFAEESEFVFASRGHWNLEACGQFRVPSAHHVPELPYRDSQHPTLQEQLRSAGFREQ